MTDTTTPITSIDTTTPITSISPSDLELFKVYLQYRSIKDEIAKKKRENPKKYRITIELDVISSNSGEYSHEDPTTDEDEDPPDFSDDEVQKDDEDIENQFKNACC
jgi:hypothetical protein